MATRFWRMTMARALALVWAGLSAIVGASEAPPPGTLTEAQAKFEVRLLKRAITALHPAPTKYNTPEAWATALQRFETRGNAARSAREMFLAATELAAAVRCGHTWTNPLNQAGAAKAALFDAADKLPILLVMAESRWRVLASADAQVHAGDEILAINGIAGADVVARMLPYVRADGASDGKRLRQLNHDRNATSLMDLVWPLLSPPPGGRYELTIRRADGGSATLTVAATTLTARRAALAAAGFRERSEADDANTRWRFEIAGDIATLTLPTFSVWRSDFDWRAFLADAFRQLDEQGIGQLIIDIRDNEGGDGAINRTLMSHLLAAPFTWPESRPVVAYERVPYILVKYLDTWNYDFFDRTGQVEPIGERQFLFKPAQAVNRTITPVARPFRGKTWLLVGGENSSATYQLAWLVKLSGVATLAGQPTGGNLRGLNGGELMWVTLPHSGVAVDIPVIASLPLVPQPDAPVVPDIEVQRSFASTVEQRDLEREAVLQVIARTRGEARQANKPAAR